MYLSSFSHGGKDGQAVNLVLSCVDNFEARMAINTVRFMLFVSVAFKILCNSTRELKQCLQLWEFEGKFHLFPEICLLVVFQRKAIFQKDLW